MLKSIFLVGFLSIIHLSFGQQPLARFSADTTEGCVPLSVNFINQCGVNATFHWSFGDGAHSTVYSPSHLYTKSGLYEVRLIASTAQGNDTLIKKDYIRVHPKPKVDYLIKDTVQCLLGDSVEFTNLGDTANSYTWVFGDGNSQQSYHASHQYQSAGTYQTLLTASSPNACVQKKSLGRMVKVFANPVPDFSVDEPLVCEENKLIHFTSASSSLSHHWDFGDGNLDSSSAKVAHIYQQEGVYDVSLSLNDQNGCKSNLTKKAFVTYQLAEKARVLLAKDTLCSREKIQFQLDSNWISAQWDFSDGNFSSELHPVHQYQSAGKFKPTVTLKDSIGCEVKLKMDSLEIHQKPIASIAEDDSLEKCIPYQFSPKNTSFFASSYQWQLDTLFHSSAASPTFHFEDAGSFSLHLISSNNYCSDTLRVKKMIELQGGKVEVEVSDSAGCAPLDVDFSIEESGFRRLKWDFGNGDTASGSQVNYTYENGGNYHPILITETNFGCEDTIQLDPIEVLDAKAVFQQVDTIVLCQAGSVSFDGSSIGGKTWTWDFGDGDSSNLSDPKHFFDSAGVYDVGLQTENTHGCYFKINPYNVVVVKDQQANLKFSRKNCPDHQVNFQATDSNIVSWDWDFGDGSGDTVQKPIHYYDDAGFYTLSLTTVDRDGCVSKQTLLNGVEILACVNGDSVANSGMGGSKGNVVLFSDSSKAIQACSPYKVEMNLPFDSIRNQWWNFGDGNLSTQKNPVHWYSKAGKYNLTLIVEDSNGVFDTLIKENFVKIGKPEARFVTQITNECDSAQLQLINQSKSAVRYLWDLGQAGSSSSQHVQLAFKDSSNHLIKLTAYDQEGCSHQLNKNIAVGTPNPYFNFQSEACLGDTITFKSNVLNYHRLEWSLGGKVMIGDTVKFSPPDTGIYRISVKAFDRHGCFKEFHSPKNLRISDPKADFSFQGALESCDQVNLKLNNLSTGASRYRWFFGNGDTVQIKEPIYTYTEKGSYKLTLEAIQGVCADRKTLDKEVVVNKAEVDFEVVQTGVCLPIQAQFYDRSEAAVSWNWDFGDGDSSVHKNPSHRYVQKPKAQSLTIVDTNGCQGKVSKQAIQLHAAKILADRWEGCIPLKIQFNDTTSNVERYFWDFGDGTTSRKKNLQHIYQKEGSYNLKLISKSKEGCSDTLFMEDAIIAGKVKADFFSSSKVDACAPHLAVFENKSTGADHFQWNFGDQNTSTISDPAKVYHKAGLFDVSLIADNGHSCADTLIKQKRFNINTPEVDFSISDTSVCGPQAILLKDLSKRVKERKWFLGDGQTATAQSFSHQYEQIGSYQITLTVTDTAGCQEFISKNVRVKKKPIAKFSLDTTMGCSPVEIKFNNHSTQLENAQFKWSIQDDSFYSSGKDTSILFSSSGLFDLALLVTNRNKCKDTAILKDHLKIFETKEIDQSRILSLSRTLSGDCKINWEKNQAFEFKAYRLYRKNEAGSYQSVFYTEDADENHFQLPFRNDWESRQCFKLETIYYCAARTELDELDEYCSVELSSTSDSSGNQLNWTAYPSSSFEQIEIWRKPLQGGSFFRIATLSSDQLTALDTTFLCPENYVYRLKIVDIFGLGYWAWSDTAVVQAKRNIQSFSPIIKRASVINNEEVLLEWEKVDYSPQVVSGYRLERSMSRGGFRVIEEFDLNHTAYLDDWTNPNDRAISYKLLLKHQCKTGFKVEKRASSIWLKIDAEGVINHLKWTVAEGLKGGVKQYHIQKKNSRGEWETVKTVDSQQLDAVINLDDLD